ncbi:PAS domain S-box protein [Natrialbaceae archaeon A-arb3/5]
MGERAGDRGAVFSGDTTSEVACERYRTLLHAIDDGIYQLDSKGRFTAINEPLIEMTGHDRSDLLGEHASMLFGADDFDRVNRALRRQLDGENGGASVEVDLEASDGTQRPCEIRLSIIESEGALTGSVGVVRERAERTPQASPQQFEQQSYETITNVLDQADVGVFVLNEEFEIAWVDETIEDYFGLDRAELIGRDKRRLIDERIADFVADPDAFEETVRATYDDNSYVERFECRITADEDGSRKGRWLEHRSRPIDSGQYAGGRVELYYDITDRKRSESALRESEARFQSMVDAVEEYAIFRLDPNGRIVSWNEGAREIKGYDREEILGEHVSTFYTESDRAVDAPGSNLEAANQTGSYEEEGWRIRKDGSRFWADVTITAIRDDDGTHRGYVKVTRDMTDRRERERQLQRERDVTDHILELSPAGIMVFDGDGEISRINERCAEILDVANSNANSVVQFDGTVYDERERRLSPDGFPFERVREADEAVMDQPLRIERPDGERQWIVMNAAEVHATESELDRTVVTVEDITEIKERERELESELETILDRITSAFYALDDDWTFTYVNEQARELIDFDDRGLLGRNFWETFEWAADSTLRDEYERAMETQKATSFELYYPEPLDTWLEIHAYPSETGLSVYFQDISARKKREQRLSESERRYRALVESFPNGIVMLFDHDFRYSLAAGQGFDRVPIDPSDLEGEFLRDVWPEETADELEPVSQAALEGDERSVELEYAGRTWNVRSVPITDEHGSVFAGMTMAQDITERKERERYLEDAKSQLEAATEAGAVGTWEWHIPEDDFVTDASFAKTFGIDPANAREGVPLDQLLSSIHDDDRERVQTEIQAAIDSAGEYESEYRVWNADDELRWVVARGHVECDEDGRPVTFPGALTDITERKRAEIALQKSRRQLETLFEVLPVGVVVANADGELVRANNTAKEIWGGDVFDADSVEEYKQYSAVWADSGEPVAPDEWTMAQVLAGDAVTDPNVYEIETFDDETRIIMEHGMPVLDEHGEVSRAVVTITEITERREYQRRLEASNERLEHFAYAASHDLQEPLRMVSSYLQLIESRYGDQLDEDGREFLEFAVNGADRMREMIDGLLEYSRIETQGDPLEPTDLDTVIADTLEDLQVRIQETDAELTTDPLPVVRGDDNQLRQLFQNLLSNALEYSGDDPPRVHVSAEPRGSMWAISVRDEGIGIDPEDQDRIFDVFERLHSREEYSGTGIGLALCQRIAERHGGELWVDSEPGEGSTFWMTLPVAEESADD